MDRIILPFDASHVRKGLDKIVDGEKLPSNRLISGNRQHQLG
jgi:hypothetical protein